ncbi:hypothetical protein N1851_016140 [Merluccius polli]|uniref:HAT C-terminal dimerisation domain-containing protein n=1 Tax=Merluccius polli TaxID=89951 RepID=A0AA47P1H6_MERPO|nr:hypothetical protein N1851_016140 [Merluccius polli]
MMSHSILRSIADRIRALPVLQFSIIVDGTQDISGTEQESICLRYVDQDLVPQEVFMGLYQTNDTTGRVLANIALDALTRLNLPLASLRGKTYDGASNMSRQPPKRFTGQSEGRRPNSAEEHYRAEYFEVLDLINAHLKDRFQQGGLLNLESLENTLLTGQVSSSTEGYPELNHQSLSIQLPMFLANYKFSSVAEAAQILRGLHVQVRSLFGTVETLIRLLLVVPISTAEAERSFSALRRLKTWLRSTMSQRRLNSVAVCHAHQECIDQIRTVHISQQFAIKTERRESYFGKY